MKSVTAWYQRALENASEARHSFQMLTDAAPIESVDVWKADIEEAEATRSNTPSAMDIMHSKIKTSQSLKVITAAVMQEDMVARNDGHDVIGITDWILEGLHIEEEQ